MAPFVVFILRLQLCWISLDVCLAMSEHWCNMEATDCHVTLEVDYRMTMMNGQKLVKLVNGKLYNYDSEIFNGSAHVSPDDIITADGYHEPRIVMAVNGSIPGPALHVRLGQLVHLHIHNKMMHETTTIHIHGQHQHGTPFSDGVPFVTQCPILPGQQFDQTFTAYPEGSYFYHAHSGPQMTNGVYGAFIVHPRSRVTAGQREFILMFHDWNHSWDTTTGALKMRWGLFHEGHKHPTSKTLAKINYSAFLFQSGLINGKGRFYDNDGKHNSAPLSVFTVEANQTYRLRLFHPGEVYPFRVSIDEHRLLVVASDGYEVEPFEVESVIIHPAERIDVLITCNKSLDNYWIRGHTLEVGYEHVAEAILNYRGVPKDQEPISIRAACCIENPCRVFNCPFRDYPQGSYTFCHNFDKVKSAFPERLEPRRNRPIVQYFLNFAFPGYTETPGSVNGRAYRDHSMSPLVQHQDSIHICSREECGDNKVCHCPYYVSISNNDLIQLVFLNMGAGRGWDHPVHLHGHSFQVVKYAYPEYDPISGEFLRQNSDIDCGQGERGFESFCNNARWANASWNSGNIPGLELDKAPVKDSILVPSGGYVIIRFKADNPGLWTLHCHINLHMHDGMLALVNESFNLWPRPPANFPRCNSYRE